MAELTEKLCLSHADETTLSVKQDTIRDDRELLSSQQTVVRSHQ
jgi:hypothetical protein